MNRLIFRDAGWRELRQTLLAASPDEAAAALIVTSGTTANGRRILVREVLLPEHDDYLDRGPLSANLTPKFVARALKRARTINGGVIFVHTHPFATDAEFSEIDQAAHRLLAPTLWQRSPHGPHGSMVVTQTDFHCHLLDAQGLPVANIDRVCEVGTTYSVDQGAQNDVQEIAPYLDRNVRAFGRAGQQRLAALRVAVVGVGGTGSIVVEELARLGVGALLLIDPEHVEETNLNRLIGAQISDVGIAKVEVAARAALRARSDIRVESLEASALSESTCRQVLDCDFAFLCTDTHGSRAVLNQLSYQYLLPMIDVGVRIDAQAEIVTDIVTRVQLLAPSLACLNCHPLLNPNAIRQDLLEDKSTDPYIVGFHEPQPAVVSINATASSSAVTMFLNAAAGVPGRARHLIGRPIDGTVRPIRSRPNPECIVCAEHNAFAKADTWPMIWVHG